MSKITNEIVLTMVIFSLVSYRKSIKKYTF